MKVFSDHSESVNSDCKWGLNGLWFISAKGKYIFFSPSRDEFLWHRWVSFLLHSVWWGLCLTHPYTVSAAGTLMDHPSWGALGFMSDPLLSKQVSNRCSRSHKFNKAFGSKVSLGSFYFWEPLVTLQDLTSLYFFVISVMHLKIIQIFYLIFCFIQTGYSVYLICAYCLLPLFQR